MLKFYKLFFINKKISFLLTTLIIGLASVSFATDLEFSISTLQTGGLVGNLNTVGDDFCPADPTNGCDFDATDSIIRTNDDVEYQFNINVGPEGDDVAFTTVLKPGMVWPSIPAVCDPLTSSITGDGSVGNPSTLYCDLGYKSSYASTFSLFARALGDQQNGTVSGIQSAVFDGPNSAAVNPPLPADVTITASPRMNLRKSILTYRPEKVNGVYVYRVWYTYWIETWKHDTNGNPADDPEPMLGNEMLQGPITFTEDPTSISPNAYIDNCYVSEGTSSSYPYQSYNSTYPDRSVLEAGSASCSATGPSANHPVTVTVTGADLSLSHYPTKSRSGAALPATRKIAAYGTIRMIIPLSDFDDAGGSLPTTNTYSDFDPTSISGMSNFGAGTEDISDNSYSRTFTEGSGSWSKSYRNSVPSEPNPGIGWSMPPTTATATYAGDGLVLPNQKFGTLLYFNNASFSPISGVAMCDVIDSRYYEIVDINPGDATDIYGTASQKPDGTTGAEGVDYLLEYGIGYVNTWPPAAFPAPTAVKDECIDPSVQWFTNTTDARLAGEITKVRYTRLTDFPIGNGGVVIKHRAKTIAQLTGVPNGTLLINMASVKSDNPATYSNWRDCNYQPGDWPAPSQVTSSCGDRLILTRTTARIDKATVPNDVVDYVLAGGTVRYKLAPVFTSNVSTTDNIIIRDQLPPNVSYISGSSIPFEPVVTGTPATGQTLTWDLGVRVTNVVIDPLEFSISVPINTPNGTNLDNTAIIDANTDASTEVQKSDTRRVTVTAQASLIIGKSTTTPLVDQDNSFDFVIEYYNGKPTDISNSDFIDVLPYNGDNRTPPSNFSGTYSIDPISFSTPTGTAYYSNLAPASIITDPLDASNDLATGSTKWCIAADFGTAGCPTNFTDVTAVRLIDLENLPSGVTRSITIDFNPVGNAESDVYTNIARGYGESVVLRPYSSFAEVHVRDYAIDYGDAPGYIEAQHSITVTILGSVVDDDDGSYGGNGVDDNGNATDDDLEGNDDEDSVASFDPLSSELSSYSVDIVVNNGSAFGANLIGWIDFDRDGVFDADEASTAAIAAGQNGSVTLTWSNIGGSGPDISAGTSYARFRISTDAALTSSTPGGLMADGEVEDYQLDIVATGSVSGNVKDSNGNPLTGVTVEIRDPGTGLVVNDLYGNPLTTTTDGSGNYNFTNVPVGDYEIVETDPTNYTSSADNDTSTDGDTNANTSQTDSKIPVTITAGKDDVDNNFVDTPVGTISGSVKDPDGNPVVGATVVLQNPDGTPALDANGNPIPAVTVNPATGAYSFANVPAGDYKIVETNPTNYISTNESSDQTGDPANASTTDDIIPVSLTVGENDNNNDFVDTLAGTVSGSVKDSDGNPLTGVTVEIRDPGTGLVINDVKGNPLTTTTDGSGNYSFIDVPLGDYEIVETDLSNYQSSADGDNSADSDNNANTSQTDNKIPVTITAGKDDINNDFVDTAVGTISGSVKDPDGNPVVGATVALQNPDGTPALDASGAAIPAVTVDPATGTYSFANVPIGDYKIVETNPAGYISTNESSDQTGDPANASTTDDIIPVTITIAENDSNNDFIDTLASDLSITKEADEHGPELGEQVVYTITVTNNGPADATGVNVNDVLPAGLSFASATGCDAPSTGNPNCTLGSIANGASKSYTVTADVLDTGAAGADDDYNDLRTNTVTVSGDQLDTNAANDTATENVTISGLELTKLVCNLTAQIDSSCDYPADFTETSVGEPGDLLEYRIDYTRYGIAAFDTILTDVIPVDTDLELDTYAGNTEVSLICPDAANVFVETGAVATINLNLANSCVLNTATRADGVTVSEALLQNESGHFLFRVKIK